MRSRPAAMMILILLMVSGCSMPERPVEDAGPVSEEPALEEREEPDTEPPPIVLTKISYGDILRAENEMDDTPPEQQGTCGNDICEENEDILTCRYDCGRYFPNFYQESTAFDGLMEAIGVDTAPTSDTDQIILKANAIKDWMHSNYVPAEQTNECFDYLNKDLAFTKAWYSPDMYGRLYERYGRVCRGTCHYTSHLFATLMYKAGVPEDRLFVLGKATISEGAKSHWYLGMRLEGDDIIYIDPQCGGTIQKDKDLFCQSPDSYNPCVFYTPDRQSNLYPIKEYCTEQDYIEPIKYR